MSGGTYVKDSAFSLLMLIQLQPLAVYIYHLDIIVKFVNHIPSPLCRLRYPPEPVCLLSIRTFPEINAHCPPQHQAGKAISLTDFFSPRLPFLSCSAEMPLPGTGPLAYRACRIPGRGIHFVRRSGAFQGTGSFTIFSFLFSLLPVRLGPGSG